MRVVTSMFAGLALVAITATGLTAAEFCVTCESPVASYTCSYSAAGAAQDDARLKLYCITELAKAGQHASCTVDRTKRAPCGGEVKTFAMPDGMTESPPSPPQPAAAAPQPAPQVAAPPAKGPSPDGAQTSDAPPKTIKEMVEKGNASTSKALEKTGETAVDAAKSTGTAIGNAGKAVGNAAKKTWNCITSFFGDC